MTTKAPETIWAITTEVTGAVVTGAWADTVRALPRGIDPPEYVRADLHAAVLAEVKAERDNWRESSKQMTEFYEHRGRLLEHETARAEAAEAALATAREDALRDAAAVCEWHAARQHPDGAPESDVMSYGYAANDCAAAILALIERKP